ASGGRDRIVRLWAPGSLPKLLVRPRLTLTGHKGQVWFAVPAPDGKRLLTGGDDGTVRLWSVQADTLRGTYPLPARGAGGAVPPDGRTAAGACQTGAIHLLDASTGKERLALRGHRLPVRALAFATDGKKLASVSGRWDQQKEPGEVKVWDARTGKE